MNFFKRKMDEQAERKRKSQRVLAMLAIGGALGTAVISAIIMGAMAIFNTAERNNVAEVFGEAVAVACNPVPVGGEAANLPNSPSPRRTVLMITNTGRRHGWNNEIPEAWRGTNGTDTALVGCVNQDWVEIEECTYSIMGPEGEPFTRRISRNQHEVVLALTDPATGRGIDTLTLKGTEPEACPATAEEAERSQTWRGEEVVWADAAAWLEAYAFAE